MGGAGLASWLETTYMDGNGWFGKPDEIFFACCMQAIIWGSRFSAFLAYGLGEWFEV